MNVNARNQMTEYELEQAEESAKHAAFSDAAGMAGAARAAVVNRTHRIVRERASMRQVQQKRVRSLWIPLGVSTSLLAVLVCALWTAFEDFEASPAGLPDTSQMLVLLMWSVPLSAMVLAVVWFRRGGMGSAGSGVENERAR